jgi:hypothetical protein
VEPGTPIPFVVGCGRSGTTILRLMLNAHPTLAVPPESHFLRRAARKPGTTTPESLLERALGSTRFADWGVDPEAVRAAASQRPPRTLAEATDLVFSAYASAHGKSRWGDKTPPYVTCIDGLASMLPDARFVHLIRDGRDVALSFSSVSFGPRDDPVAQAHYWRRRVGAGRRSGAQLGPDRYLEVRYEDLVDDPERELRRVCSFVDLDFDAAMLRYQQTVGEALPDERRVHHANADKPISRNIRDWRTSMPTEQRAWFEAVAGDLLAELGYDVTDVPAPRGLGTRLTIERARDRLGELRASLRSP